MVKLLGGRKTSKIGPRDLPCEQFLEGGWYSLTYEKTAIILVLSIIADY